MHFRIRDLAADRCVWSVPPIDTVPVKLRCRMLDVRAFDVHDKMVGRAHSEGETLADIIKQLFADPHARYLHVHFATDDAYAARVDRFAFAARSDLGGSSVGTERDWKPTPNVVLRYAFEVEAFAPVANISLSLVSGRAAAPSGPKAESFPSP
jgi:Protein of unknown function (DUF1203)